MAAEVVEGKRDYGNYDLKRDARREWVYFLWLRGKKLREIEEITGSDRVTILRYIKYIIERLTENPRSIEEIRQEALFALRLDRAEIFETINEAKSKEKVNYGQIAKLYAEAVGIDKLILQRYTQSRGPQSVTGSQIDKAKIILDFIVTKYGPEALDNFEEYYTRQLMLKQELNKNSAKQL